MIVEVEPEAGSVPTPDEEGDKDLPPALQQMVEDRRANARDAAEAAARAAVVLLDPAVWADIEARAKAIGVTAELLDDGGLLRLVAPLPPLASSSEPAAEA
jgi:hypothetical protein